MPLWLPAQATDATRRAPNGTTPAGEVEATSESSEDADAVSPPTARKTDPRVGRWVRALFWSVVLLVVLIFAAMAIVVFSRRYRRYLLRGRTKATPTDDLWTTHKLPPDALSELDAPPEDKP